MPATAGTVKFKKKCFVNTLLQSRPEGLKYHIKVFTKYTKEVYIFLITIW